MRELTDQDYTIPMLTACLENWESLVALSHRLGQGVRCIVMDIRRAVNTLSSRKQKAFQRYYVEGDIQEDVADSLGISQQYLSREVLPDIPKQLHSELTTGGDFDVQESTV